MSYSMETYKADKNAIDAAKSDLSALVIGEKIGRTALYSGEYARISQYFDKEAGDTMRRIARMFYTISTANHISGFDCNVYATLLEEIEKKIKSLRVFRRKKKIRCLLPKLHSKDCVCADWQRLMEASNESQENGREIPSRQEESALEGIV